MREVSALGSAILLLFASLVSGAARADETGSIPGISERIQSIRCTLYNGRFTADVTAVPGGGFTARITRFMNGTKSVRFEGTVSGLHGDGPHGEVTLMFTSPDAEAHPDDVPAFALAVDEASHGELYSNRFKYPRQSVTGPCQIAYLP